MAVWSSSKFKSLGDALNFLNGAMIGSANLYGGAEVDGLTFIYDIGGGDQTITFTPAKSRAWTPTEIAAHINTTYAGSASIVNVSTPTTITQRLRFNKDVASLTIKSSGTANSLLGYSTTSDTVQDPIPNTEVEFFGLVPGEQDTWVVVRYA